MKTYYFELGNFGIIVGMAPVKKKKHVPKYAWGYFGETKNFLNHSYHTIGIFYCC